MDLSWPKGASVNDAIHKYKHLDTYFYLQYPSVDNILPKIKDFGQGALLYKVDISRAFHHICIDLGDIGLFAMSHKHLYLDGSLLFGSEISEHCRDTVRWIMKKYNDNIKLH